MSHQGVENVAFYDNVLYYDVRGEFYFFNGSLEYNPPDRMHPGGLLSAEFKIPDIMRMSAGFEDVDSFEREFLRCMRRASNKMSRR